MKQALVIILSVLSLSLWAQSERKYVRKGNDAYYDGKPDKAIEAYQKALGEAPESPEAHFNLGNAYYKQKDYENATASYQTAAGLFKDNKQKAEALHNIGNTYLDQQKFKEAKEAYQQALRLNPKDSETRYNLAMANKMLQKQEQEQENQDQEKQEEEKNEDEQKQDQQDKGDDKNQNDKGQEKESEDKNSEEKDEQEKDGKPEDTQDGGDQEKEAQPQPLQEGQISKEEAERMLDALKNEEQKLQEKLLLMQKQKGERKNLEKDW